MLVVSPGLAGNPGFDLISDAGANPGVLTYDSGPPVSYTHLTLPTKASV